ERNGFCLWLKRLESERFKTSPDEADEAIVLMVQEIDYKVHGVAQCSTDPVRLERKGGGDLNKIQRARAKLETVQKK
ncbi:hypothetical protein APX70_04056, partial [Pseudomonas syringae pv. maculicola]